MRYLILVGLNIPIIVLACSNIITQYKLGRITKNRFRWQLVLWFIILVVLIASFPLYNIVSSNPILDSTELSLFDIAQTTVIVGMIYILNYQRQRNDYLDKRLSNLHREISIRLSKLK